MDEIVVGREVAVVPELLVEVSEGRMQLGPVYGVVVIEGPSNVLLVTADAELVGQPAPRHVVMQSVPEHEVVRDEAWLLDIVGVIIEMFDKVLVGQPAPKHTLAHNRPEHDVDQEVVLAKDAWLPTDVVVIGLLDVVLGGQPAPTQTLAHSRPEHAVD